MSWAKVNLGRFLKVRDNRYKPNDKAIAGLKRIDKIDFSGEIFISDKSSNTDMILIKKGDLVISGINVEKGAMAVYTGENDITATIHYSSYYFDENETDIDFLKQFLKSLEFKKALKEQVPGGIKTEIKPKHILPLLVEIPTGIKDQKTVVKLLQNRNSKVEAISNDLSHQLLLVRKLRQQFSQEAIQGKLVEQNKKDEPANELLKKIKAEKEKLVKQKKLKKEKELPPIKREEIPFEIPKNWAWCRLGEATIDISYGTSEKAHIVGEIPVLRMGNITTNGEILYSNLKYVPSTIADLPKLYLQKGDLVFNRTNSYELVGKSGVFENDDKYTLASYLIRVRFHSLIQPKFIATYINSKICRQTQLEPKIIQQNGQANFNGTKLSNILVPLPPFNEQQRIIKKLETLLQHCDELEASVKQNVLQNEHLLQQVLREALRPNLDIQLEHVQLPVLQPQEENHFVKRKVLASYIINQSLSDSKFGDVKFEKLLHLSDYFALKRNLGQKYFQQAAGPYDNAFTRAYFQQIENSKWFKRTRSGNQFIFSAAQNHTKSTNTYDYFSSEELSRVNGIINYFKKCDYEQPEIISTLYAVWNNRIIKQEPITDDLLKQDFLNWDAQKIKYKDRLDAALNWMRKEGVVPDGWGKVIEKAKRNGKRNK